MAWVSPTGFVDPDTEWVNGTRAYDEDTDLYAYDDTAIDSWSSFIELTHAAILCDKIRVWVLHSVYRGDIDVDIYYGAAWHDVYEGTANDLAWTEVPFAQQTITAFRFRQHNDDLGQARTIRLYEADFGEVAAAGWTGKIMGVTNPAKIYGVEVANIAKVMGVEAS